MIVYVWECEYVHVCVSVHMNGEHLKIEDFK